MGLNRWICGCGASTVQKNLKVVDVLWTAYPFFRWCDNCHFFFLLCEFFFLRIDLLVGVLFLGCFFGIVQLIFFFTKKRHEFPLMWKLWHICKPHYFIFFFFSYVFYSGYSVRTYIYEHWRMTLCERLWRRWKRYLSVLLSSFLTAVHLRKWTCVRQLRSTKRYNSLTPIDVHKWRKYARMRTFDTMCTYIFLWFFWGS